MSDDVVGDMNKDLIVDSITKQMLYHLVMLLIEHGVPYPKSHEYTLRILDKIKNDSENKFNEVMKDILSRCKQLDLDRDCNEE